MKKELYNHLHAVNSHLQKIEISRYRQELHVSFQQTHRGGEKKFIDFAILSIGVIDQKPVKVTSPKF
jgi:hypothetical protein